MSRLALALVTLLIGACGALSRAAPDGSGNASAITNDAGCPATWLDARHVCAGELATGLSCTGFGPGCSYPGAGDQLPGGAFATAVLFCMDVSGDGGPGEWRCSQ